MRPDAKSYMIRLRLEQADLSLLESRTLLEKDLYPGAVNRAYYAMFYCVLALLIYKGVSVARHSGAITMFDLNFVKAGLLKLECSRWLHDAFDQRMQADYGELTQPDRETAQQTLNNAVEFVGQVKAFLDSQSAA